MIELHFLPLQLTEKHIFEKRIDVLLVEVNLNVLKNLCLCTKFMFKASAYFCNNMKRILNEKFSNKWIDRGELINPLDFCLLKKILELLKNLIYRNKIENENILKKNNNLNKYKDIKNNSRLIKEIRKNFILNEKNIIMYQRKWIMFKDLKNKYEMLKNNLIIN